MIGQNIQKSSPAASADKQLVPVDYGTAILYPLHMSQIDQIPFVAAEKSFASQDILHLLETGGGSVNTIFRVDRQFMPQPFNIVNISRLQFQCASFYRYSNIVCFPFFT